MFVGEWLNGRVAVSKTVGCVFESRLPCQIKELHFAVPFLFLITHATFCLCKKRINPTKSHCNR